MNNKHEIAKTEALCEGITITPIDHGYGSYGIRITGIDHSENNRPFSITLSFDNIVQINEIGFLLNDEKDKYERLEKQIFCNHFAENGVCLNCGALEAEFKNLQDIKYSRTYIP